MNTQLIVQHTAARKKDTMKIQSGFILSVMVFFLSIGSCSPVSKGDMNENTAAGNSDYHVAAYIWPSCHDDPLAHELLWSEGMGEWEVIRKGTPRFEGHYQPKVPLWGYEADNDPRVMEKWINVATGHGVDIFIFDWYWYAEGPYLESSLNDGFLKARNNREMQFYLMWANHDVKKNYWNVQRYGDDDSLLWDAAVDWENFRIIVQRTIDTYFSEPNYFRIDGCPVFSIFGTDKLIETFGSVEKAAEALAYFREETRKAGFPDLHLQLIVWDVPNSTILEKIDKLGANSITNYNWGRHKEDYIQWGVEAVDRMYTWSDSLSIPYFPNVSIGWDDTPRFPHKNKADVVHLNNTPQSFAAFLQKAKDYCDEKPDQLPLITLFSWNEWVEGSYLLPDMKNGYGYLEAVKAVMSGELDEDRYQ